jgi:AhpD family alkylhydroperoxidase
MRLDYARVVPAVRTAMLGLEQVVHDSDLDPGLLELVKIRASQINRCARCLEMHNKDARARGESQDRLDVVAAWSEAGCFSAQERAALAWCEALTLIADTGAPDDVYDAVSEVFEPAEIVVLTLAITAINAWNRLNVGLRIPAGGYESRLRPAATADDA